MKEGAGGQLDLTSPIKAFTDIVMRSAIQINVWKTGAMIISLTKILNIVRGMKIVADYKKRKELKEYLPHDEHWKLKSDRRSVEKTPASAVLAPLSTNAEAEAGDGEAKLETSEEAKKRSMEEDGEGSPPQKKCNVENGENQVISEVAIENGNGAALDVVGDPVWVLKERERKSYILKYTKITLHSSYSRKSSTFVLLFVFDFQETSMNII